MEKTVVSSVVLQDFRNFTTKEIVFDSDQTLILGNNGQGKTNVLEAIAFLSTGRSFRAKLLSDCVREGAEVAHLGAKAVVDDEEVTLSASIVSKSSEYSKRASTRFLRNGVKKRRSDVIGVVKTVLFRPEDMELITDGPSYKRNFLDDVLIQVSLEYAKSLREYEKALKHRNKLILQLREGLVTRKEFIFWDTILIKHGDVITRERKKFLFFITNHVEFPIKGEVTYDESLMSEERLHQYAFEEVAAGKTLVGPHRDNFLIQLELSEGKMSDVARFGSRGQQRMAVLWLKVAALQFIEKETKNTPLLLLDDMFSELDEGNRELVFGLFENRQVIMTSAEELSMLPKECTHGEILNL
ncbi:MAG: DNA replication and repair protein RecF [Candidatus Woesebacteria bacterium]